MVGRAGQDIGLQKLFILAKRFAIICHNPAVRVAIRPVVNAAGWPCQNA
jgi:hypothetical protein